MIKILHAADLHLDSPLRGLERYEGAPVDEIRSASRAAFDRLVDLAISERVGLVLLAGDIFDGEWRDYQTGLFFASRLAKLARAMIPSVVVRGNHDAASRISRALVLPQGVHELSTAKPQTVVFDEIGLAVHGQGYAQPVVSKDLTDSYPEPRPGYFNVGLLHTSVDGRPGHASYAPTTVDALASRGYDYWALGHVHQREILCEEPWIVFPGNLQGRHVRETGEKGCTLVAVEAGQVVGVEHRTLDVVRWSVCPVDITDAVSLEDVLQRVGTALEGVAEAAGGRLMAVRIRLVGSVMPAVAKALRSDLEGTAQQVRSVTQIVAGGRVWIERVLFEARVILEPNLTTPQADPVDDLVSFLRTIPEEEALLAELGEALAPLKKRLPHGIGASDLFPDLDDPEALKALLPDVEALLVPLLTSQGERS